MMSEPVHQLLHRASLRFGRRPFLHDSARGVTVSFSNATDLVEVYAQRLVRRGVTPGDRVIVVASNRIEVALLVFAISRAGALFVVLGDSVVRTTFRRIRDEVAPRLMVAGESARHLVGADDTCPCLPIDSFPVEHSADWQGLDVDSAARDPNEAGLIYTSGSSGAPRGVVATHENIAFTSERIQRRIAYRRTDVVGLLLPVSFDYGLYQLFLAARCGCQVALGSGMVAGPRLVHTLVDNQVTVFPAMPGLVAALVKLLERRPVELPRLRCLTSTGEQLPEQLVDRLRLLLPALAVFPMYGLTECKRISILVPSEIEQRAGSVGRPLDDVEVRIIDQDGAEMPVGERGQIAVRGRNVCLGYWRRSAPTSRRFVSSEGGTTLLTGDDGWLDDAGFLYVCGRRDAVTKHRSHRISLTEVEAGFGSLPHVLEAVAVQAKDGDDLHVFLTLGEGAAIPQRRALEGRLEWYKLPDHVHHLETMPRTVNGKADRARLRALAEGGGGQ